MYQVELHIPSSPYLLPVFFFIRIIYGLPSLYYRQISFCKCIPTGLSECHPEINRLLFICPAIIIKDASNTSPLIVPVKVHKVIITVLLEEGIKCRIKSITNLLISAMKMHGIFFKQIIWCQIRTATKPPVTKFTICIVYSSNIL